MSGTKDKIRKCRMKHAALYKEATVESRTIFSMCIYVYPESLYRTDVAGDYYGLYV